jgi:hypothetical protein
MCPLCMCEANFFFGCFGLNQVSSFLNQHPVSDVSSVVFPEGLSASVILSILKREESIFTSEGVKFAFLAKW